MLGKRGIIFKPLAYGSPLLWLGIFFILPLAIMFVYSFSENQGILDIKLTWTWDNYAKLLSLVYLKILLKSLILAFFTTLICLIIGFIVSLYLLSLNKYLKIFLLFLITLPFWTNMLIRTYALIAILRSKGYVNFFLEKIWLSLNSLLVYFQIEPFMGEFVPLEILYTNLAVMIGLVYVYLPFMIFPIFMALDKLNYAYIEASFDLGANYLKTCFFIILPLAKNGIKNGIIITFTPVLGSYLIPDLLGGRDSSMIANLIERQFKGANDWPLGSALSLVLIYLTFLIIFISGLKKNKT